MIFRNGKVFYNGSLIDLEIRTEEDRISAAGKKLDLRPGEECVDLNGNWLLPGFVDVHTHGREGLDFSEASAEEIGTLRKSYAGQGVTTVLATTMTMEYEYSRQMLKRIADAIESGQEGARILGINLEGPFLSHEKKGCHDERYLLAPESGVFDEFDRQARGHIRLVDVDPCYPGAMEFISRYHEDKCISIAHTTADYETACEAVRAGATEVTHLFNAMNGLHHREPGVIGMAFDQPVNAELICDGIHVHPSVIRMAFHLMPFRICLISDSMSAAGLTDGEYALGGLKVIVKDRKAANEDGTIAGSTTNVFEACRNVISFGVPVEQAILAATRNPAKAVRIYDTVGSIKEGKMADLLVVTPGFDLEQVYIGGKRYV